MSNDMRSFATRMTYLANQFAGNRERLVRTVALVADQAVVMGTPVDTGRARANWIVSLGDTPPTNPIEAYYPGEARSTASQNAAEAISQGEHTIGQHKPGQTVHITNNVEYINELNDGTSTQAPANFIEKAIQQAVAAIQGLRLLG